MIRLPSMRSRNTWQPIKFKWKHETGGPMWYYWHADIERLMWHNGSRNIPYATSAVLANLRYNRLDVDFKPALDKWLNAKIDG